MQYYYECLEVYEKLVPEVKKHCKLLRKLDAKFLVVRDSYLEALSQFEDTKEEMTPSIRLYSKQVIEKGQETLNRITQEKWKTANSLMITIEYYLSRINGYVREFKCEIDSDNTPGTSIEIEKKFLEANRKRVKEIQEIRDEYPFLDDIFKIPEPELESTESAINESMVEPIKINGHRQQNIAVLLQDIGSSFRDDHSNNLSSSVTSAQPRSSRSRKKKKKEKKKLDQAEPQSSRSSRLQNKLDHENQVKSIHKEFYNQSGNPKYSLSLNELHQRLEKENGQSSNIS
jgi:hypothetical protein